VLTENRACSDRDDPENEGSRARNRDLSESSSRARRKEGEGNALSLDLKTARECEGKIARLLIYNYAYSCAIGWWLAGRFFETILKNSPMID